MVQFKAINLNVEVSGDALLAMVDGMGAFKEVALKILAENQIKDPEKDKWYRQQDWLNAFKVISEKIGLNTLYNIGTKIPENAKWPPGVDTIEKALASIDIAYHMNHKIGNEILFNPETGNMKEGIGHYGFEKIGHDKIRMICDNPYPCDFDKGIITNTAIIFNPKDRKYPKITHDDSGLCRNKGDNQCNYIVTWY